MGRKRTLCLEYVAAHIRCHGSSCHELANLRTFSYFFPCQACHCRSTALADRVGRETPRLLINRERAGESDPLLAFLGQGFNFDEGNYRCGSGVWSLPLAPLAKGRGGVWGLGKGPRRGLGTWQRAMEGCGDLAKCVCTSAIAPHSCMTNLHDELQLSAPGPPPNARCMRATLTD